MEGSMPAGSNANKSNRELTIMNKHMKIVVIGGSDLIGTRLVNNLRQRGQEIVAASPSSGVNTITGEGLATASLTLQSSDSFRQRSGTVDIAKMDLC
jgi:nucleoside-diphosphate-sugar epimerase